ncbi:MAG: DNA polymerase domain-containing protein, partial [Candidatus Bathyarchaeia archaeon]
ALQGRYRWVVFPPSKTRPSAPVRNRYYGVFTDGRIKARGIELQRRDTPKIVRDFQAETLRLLAAAPDSASLREKAPETLEVARRYIRRINSRDVDLEDLAIRRRLSKDPGSYAHNVPQAAAAQELVKAGARVSAGQEVSYIVTDANRLRTLATPLELADAPPSYDARKYIRLITSSANTLIQPLGYTLKEDPLKILKNEKRPTGSLETFR